MINRLLDAWLEKRTHNQLPSLEPATADLLYEFVEFADARVARINVAEVSTALAKLDEIHGFVCVCGHYFEFPPWMLWDGGLFYPYQCECERNYLLYMRTAHLMTR